MIVEFWVLIAMAAACVAGGLYFIGTGGHSSFIGLARDLVGFFGLLLLALWLFGQAADVIGG